MRTFFGAVVPLGWLLFCAFCTGLLWDEPERLRAFWKACATGAGMGVAFWLVALVGWEAAKFVWSRRVSAAEKARQQERAHVVTFLRQQAEAHRQQAIHDDEGTRHGWEMGAVALENAATAVEHGHHVRDEVRS